MRENQTGSEHSIRLLPYLRIVGLLLGLLACAACDGYYPAYKLTAFLFNGTPHSQTLQVYRPQEPLDCTRSLDVPAAWPGADAFVLRECHTLASSDILPLDQGWKFRYVFESGASYIVPVPEGLAEPPCDAVVLRAQGLTPVVITWNGVSAVEVTVPERFGDDAKDDHGLILERAGDRLFIKGTSLLRALPAGFEPAPAECPNGGR